MEVSELRRRLGLTQAELADFLGVTQPAVAAWEAGRRTPTGRAAKTLERLQRSFSGPTRTYGKHRGRPIELPSRRWEPVFRPTHKITLPIHLDWSPRAGQRDFRDPVQRAGAYAQVLDEGTPTDVRVWVDPDDLAELWPDVPVARHLREPVGRLVEMLRRP
jgi:transcriptional regulator with XRE-family HTH domain